MKTLILDFSDMCCIEEAHWLLISELDFPDYYGENLDALYDVLSTYDEDLTIYTMNATCPEEQAMIQVMQDAAAQNKHFRWRDGSIANELLQLVNIDSPSAYYERAQWYLVDRFQQMNVSVDTLRKGGVLACLGGEGHPILLMAHADTLGAVVGEIKSNGHLKISNVTLNAHNIETSLVHVITMNGRVFDGTVQLTNPSIHVNGKYSETERSFDTLEIVLDEEVTSKAEVEALGIQPGDVVAVLPNYVRSHSGYIKSRYQDDKASVAILLDFAEDVAAKKINLNRKVYVLFTFYEEYGQGGACGIPDDVEDILCVDMGCVGEGLNCTEKEVSICRKDRRNVYHRGMTEELVRIAAKKGIPYAVDVYPFYSSDANVAMEAGYDVRHALIGPGIYASHGYERSHIQGLYATKDLITAYLCEKAEEETESDENNSHKAEM